MFACNEPMTNSLVQFKKKKESIAFLLIGLNIYDILLSLFLFCNCTYHGVWSLIWLETLSSCAVIAFCPNNNEVHIYKFFTDKWEKLHVLSKVDGPVCLVSQGIFLYFSIRMRMQFIILFLFIFNIAAWSNSFGNRLE